MAAAIPADTFLSAGDFFFGSGARRVRTLLGTCISIVLWHPANRVGGMCHYLLPKRGREQSVAASPPGLYADEVMKLFANKLRENQTEPAAYVVSVLGGGHMFPTQLTNSACRDGACTDAHRVGCQSIGCQNIASARRLLASGGYKIAREDVGGHGSRQILFEVATGKLFVRRGAAITPLPRPQP